MTNNSDDHNFDKEKILEIDDYCEECKKEDESVSQNLILTDPYDTRLAAHLNLTG